LIADRSTDSAWYNAEHDLSSLSPAQHMGRQPLAPLLLRTMSNDRPRCLGCGTISCPRPHPDDGHLASRLLGRRRDRDTTKQLGSNPRTDHRPFHRSQSVIPT
jgi:hypothetical protein